jgi:hypothetical protein
MTLISSLNFSMNQHSVGILATATPAKRRPLPLYRGGPVASYKRLGFGLYRVARKEAGVPIGICGLLKRESMQHFAIGFAFLKRFWAKGMRRRPRQ